MRKIVCGIYKITSPSGKIYIGESKNFYKLRLSKYKTLDCKEQIRLYNSLKHYGWEAHSLEIIEECFEENLWCRERYWQDFYDVIGKNGLNCKLTECGNLKPQISDDTRKRMSEAMSGSNHPRWGRKNSDEMNEKIRQKAIGRKHSEKTKALISEIGKGRPRLKGELSPLFGIKRSEEFKKHLSKANIGKHSGLNNPRSKLILDTQTGIFYDCVAEAAKAFSMNRGTLKCYLNINSKLKNKTSLIYC